MRTTCRVRVKPGVRKESFTESAPGVFDISVREKPEENAANDRVRQLVAQHFGVPLKSVRIFSGYHSKRKSLRIEG